jgi:hypothetical protein
MAATVLVNGPSKTLVAKVVAGPRSAQTTGCQGVCWPTARPKHWLPRCLLAHGLPKPLVAKVVAGPQSALTASVQRRSICVRLFGPEPLQAAGKIGWQMCYGGQCTFAAPPI